MKYSLPFGLKGSSDRALTARIGSKGVAHKVMAQKVMAHAVVFALCSVGVFAASVLHAPEVHANEARYKDMLGQLTQRHTQIQKTDTEGRMTAQLQEIAKWLQEANFLLGKGEVDRLDGMLRKTEAHLDLYEVQLQYEVAKARADERVAAANEARARFDEANSKLESLKRKIEAAKQGVAPSP